MALVHSSSSGTNSPERLFSSLSGGINKLRLFPSDHHMHHALAKALHKGEPSQLAPAEVPVFLAHPTPAANGTSQPVWTVESRDDGKSELLWLLTEPLESWALTSKDRWRLQLVTTSKDQGWIPMRNSFSFRQSWFEFGIQMTPGPIRSEGDQERNPFTIGDIGKPKLHPTTGAELRWHSHNNFLFGHDFAEIEGNILETDHEIWKYLGPGDRLAVYMCARHRGRKNHCTGGRVHRFRSQKRPGLPLNVVRKIMRMAGIMAPQPRVFKSEYTSEPEEHDGLWGVAAEGSSVAQELWIVTHPLSGQMIRNMAQIQLRTRSRDQGWAGSSDPNSYSWFSLGVLTRLPGGVLGPKPDPTKASYMGLWLSHNNNRGDPEIRDYAGKIFTADVEPVSGLSPGDRLVAWMHAQYGGWENFAEEGKIVYWEYFEPTLLREAAQQKEPPRKRKIEKVRSKVAMVDNS
ncbi:hypothetical protein FRC03_012748 [Tulasnella sp. 419]|nr:hypothetical protein FRC03_012748 [Tulasnella sp. 419]